MFLEPEVGVALALVLELAVAVLYSILLMTWAVADDARFARDSFP